MKIILPAYDVPPIVDGKWDATWYEKLKLLTDLVNELDARGVLDMPDVDNSTPITNTQVLIYNSTSKKLTPGAN